MGAVALWAAALGALAVGCTPFEDLDAIGFRAADVAVLDGAAIDGTAGDVGPRADQGARDAASDGATDATPGGGDDAAADAEPDAALDGGADATADAGADAEADAAPDATPDATSDALTDATSDAGPDATIDAGPDAGCVPMVERCNGLDDDCDGATDEDYAQLDAPCVVGRGACAAEGVNVCAADGAGVVCGAAEGAPIGELCNGLDDDCDGAPDEDFPTRGQACEVGVGLCVRGGAQVCAADGSGVVCSATPGAPVAERCDGRDEDCDGAVDEDFPTLGAACSEGTGACAADGEVRCDDDGGVRCDAELGAPGVETCEGSDEDCDGAVDEDFELGGACETVDDEGDCRAAGVWQCTAEGGRACSAAIGLGVDETCDGFDNDCDGAADEDFDLLADADHCGACGQSCGDLADASAACAGGLCFIGRCDDFRYDLDAERLNGCEAPAVGAPAQPRVVVVDQAVGTAEGDGTPGDPVATIPQGLALAGPGDVVSVRPGTYLGDLEIEQDFVVLRGVDADRVIVRGSITIEGDYARVEGLTVEAPDADVGIEILCAQGCGVVGNVVLEVGRADRFAPTRYGIRVGRGNDHVVHDNRVELVQGGDGQPFDEPPANECIGTAGGDAVGIQLDAGANDSRLTGNTIVDIRAGAGAGGDFCVLAPGDCGPITGSPGGEAVGIRLTDQADGHVVAGNTVRDVRGGAGGEGARSGHGGAGGRGVGLYLEGANNRVLGNRFARISGGASGTPGLLGWRGHPGVGFGVFFAWRMLGTRDGALANEVTDTNTVDGDPVVFCSGQRGAVLSGYRLLADSNPTNLGKIVLIGCDDARVEGNVVGNVRGDTGVRGTREGYPDPTGSLGVVVAEAHLGADAQGILVADADDVQVVGNTVTDVVGGAGGGPSMLSGFCASLTSGLRGGGGSGIRAVGTRRLGLADNVVARVAGGPGGLGGSDGGPGGRGGDAAGVALIDAHGGTLDGNTFTALSPGLGGPGGQLGPVPIGTVAGQPGEDGGAFGLWLEPPGAGRLGALDNTVTLTNTVDGAAIPYVYGEDGRVIEGLTIAGPTETTNLGRVVVVDARDVIVRGNTLTGVTAPGGDTGQYAAAGGEGGGAIAIRAMGTVDLRVEDNWIDGVTGGRGGPSGLARRGGQGGGAAAFLLDDALGTVLEGNVAQRIVAGLGGPGGTGLEPADSPPVPVGAEGSAGGALGLFASDSGDVTVRNMLVAGVVSPLAASGLQVTAPAGPTRFEVFNATVFGIVGGLEVGDGIRAEGADVTLIVQDSIVAQYTGSGIVATEGAVGAVDYTDVFGFDPARRVVGLNEPTGTNLNLDPQFQNPNGGDFDLQPTSPAVDAGNPIAPCRLEPAPTVGVCRVDMGHRGNTPHAISR